MKDQSAKRNASRSDAKHTDCSEGKCDKLSQGAALRHSPETVTPPAKQHDPPNACAEAETGCLAPDPRSCAPTASVEKMSPSNKPHSVRNASSYTRDASLRDAADLWKGLFLPSDASLTGCTLFRDAQASRLQPQASRFQDEASRLPHRAAMQKPTDCSEVKCAKLSQGAAAGHSPITVMPPAKQHDPPNACAEAGTSTLRTPAPKWEREAVGCRL